MRRRAHVLLVGCAIAIGDVSIARAEPGEVDVVLVDGTRVHGRIKELIPEDHCTLQLKDGLTVIPWRGIVRIVPSGSPDVPPVPGALPAPPSVHDSPRIEPSGALVRVHLIASKGVRIEKSVVGGPWELACTAPCDAELPADASYRAMDGGSQISGFRLETYGHSAITVDISAGSTPIRVFSILGVVTGTIVGYVALVGALEARHSDTTSLPIFLASLGVVTLSAVGIFVSGSGVSQKATGRAVVPFEIASRKALFDEKPTRVAPPRGLTTPIFTVPF